ncbi:MAG: L-threonylcarbamoyladenylate synthase [Candidatus Asgardarchaeia archaeon]
MVIILKVPLSDNDLKNVKKVFDDGGVIVYPTDTVYGVGGNPYNIHAVKKVFDIKKRPYDKGLPILSNSLEILEKIVEFNDKARTLIKNFWPGALTIVAPLKDKRLRFVSGGEDKIAVRIPNDEITLKLIEAIGGLIIGTSANISGKNPCIDSECVMKQIGKKVDILIDAGIHGIGKPSTVIEVEDDEIKILRTGTVDVKAIMSVLEE